MAIARASSFHLLPFAVAIFVCFAILDTFHGTLVAIFPESISTLPPFVDYLLITSLTLVWYRRAVGVKPSMMDQTLFAVVAALSVFALRMGIVFFLFWEEGIPISTEAVLSLGGFDEEMVVAILSVPYLLPTLTIAAVTLDMVVVAIITAFMTRDLPED